MIHGLLPSLSESGRIKLGQKGKAVISKDGKTFRLPEKLSFFRLTTTEKDLETDDFITDTEMMDILKKGGKATYNAENELTGIPIRLLYNTIDMNLSTQYVSYVGGKLTCSGDGQKAQTRDGRDVPCPCNRLNGTYTGKDKCKLYSVLSVLIEGSRIGSCWKLRSTSKNTAKHLISSMLLIKALTGGLLAFLPLQLVVRPKKTIIPNTGQPTTVYVASIEYPGGIEELQKKALEMGAESAKLITNMHEIEAETRRIVAPVNNEKEEFETAIEFFPDSIELASDQPDQIKTTTTKKNTGKKKAGSKPVESQNKAEPEQKEDNLLGTTTKSERINKDTDAITKSTEPETKITHDAGSAPMQECEKIRKDQLVKILDLKVNKRQINDQKVWHKLIKNMKFPDVTKANDMTVEQGDKFIAYLEALEKVPF